MAKEGKYTDAVLYEYAGDMLAAFDKPSAKFYVDPSAVRAILHRFRALIEAQRSRKGRPPHRPRGGDVGEMVEAHKARGLNETEARQAVARQMQTEVRTVAQAHRRWLKRKPRSAS